MSTSNELLQLAESLQKKFDQLLQKLNIDRKELSNFKENDSIYNNKWVACSINSTHHKMPASSIENHELRCRLKGKGIDPDKIDLLPSLRFAYDGSPGVVSFHDKDFDSIGFEVVPEERQPVTPLSSFIEVAAISLQPITLQPLNQIADLIVEDAVHDDTHTIAAAKQARLVSATPLASEVEKLPKTKVALKNYIKVLRT